jgi:hypothetical protein
VNPTTLMLLAKLVVPDVHMPEPSLNSLIMDHLSPLLPRRLLLRLFDNPRDIWHVWKSLRSDGISFCSSPLLYSPRETDVLPPYLEKDIDVVYSRRDNKQ